MILLLHYCDQQQAYDVFSRVIFKSWWYSTSSLRLTFARNGYVYLHYCFICEWERKHCFCRYQNFQQNRVQRRRFISWSCSCLLTYHQLFFLKTNKRKKAQYKQVEIEARRQARKSRIKAPIMFIFSRLPRMIHTDTPQCACIYLLLESQFVFISLLSRHNHSLHLSNYWLFHPFFSASALFVPCWYRHVQLE